MHASTVSPLTVVGGAGFLGSAVVEHCVSQGRPVVSVDRREDRSGAATPAGLRLDLLADPLPEALLELPEGPVALLAGNSNPRAVRGWELVLDNVVATARLLPFLAGRRVVLASSVEVYGRSPGRHREDAEVALPVGDDVLRAWNAEAVALAARPCPPWRAERLCRTLADHDPGGRWVYALAKRAQELLLSDAVPEDMLTVFRVANLFGAGQDRVVTRLARRARARLPLHVVDTRRTFLAVGDLARAIAAEPPAALLNAGAGDLGLVEVAELVLDELGVDGDLRVTPAPEEDVSGVVDTSHFRELTGVGPAGLREALRAYVARVRDDGAAPAGPPIPVVVPPRPEHPEVVADRIQRSLWSGTLKDGPWTSALTGELRSRLELPDDLTVLPTSSGTAALRLATVAVAGRPEPGDVAVLPSFTFPATGEVLAMLGYRLRYCDVSPSSWTLDPRSLEAALAPGDVRVVVAVDALGAPADYEALLRVCRRHDVPLVADSAPALGARWRGRPVGRQADAHAFSLSFAKVVSAAGGGGALVVPAGAVDRLRADLDWTRSTVLGEVHAAVALDLLVHLDRLLARRRAVAEVYAELERADPRVRPQRVADGDEHGWGHWVACFRGVDRDRVAKSLDAAGIGTKPYYAPALHRLPGRALAAEHVHLPVTDTLHDEALALPMSSELSPMEAERVFWAVLAALEEAGDDPR